MKKQFLSLILALSLLIAAPVSVGAQAADKVTVCHSPSETGDHCDRYVFKAGEENKHFNKDGTPKPGHEQDRIFEGEVDCHSEEESKKAKEEHAKNEVMHEDSPISQAAPDKPKEDKVKEEVPVVETPKTDTPKTETSNVEAPVAAPAVQSTEEVAPAFEGK